MTYISSQSLAVPLRTSVLRAQADLSQAQTEISTGVHADIGLTLGARTGLSLSLNNEIDRLDAYKTSNGLTSSRLDATSNALSSMLSAAQDMKGALLTASSSGGASSSVLTAAAKNALQSFTSTMNTVSGNQYVFGGINSDTAPIAAYNDTSSAKAAVDGAFQSYFSMSPSSSSASSITGSQMQAFLDGPFANLFADAGWKANWSKASDQVIQSEVAPGQTDATSVTANETTVRQVASAYTMLSEFTGANFSDSARAAVVSTATKQVGSGVEGFTNLSANVGVMQNSITTANDSMGAQVDTLKSNVSDLEGVDPYALSVKVSQLQTQLQASYELTSKLSQLSLVNYLK